MSYKGKTTPADLQRLVDKYKRDKSNAECEVNQLQKELNVTQEKLNTIKDDILSIGDVLSAAVSHGGDIDYHELNDKLHEMYLLLEE